MRPASAATTLIEQHHAVRRRVEQPPMPRRTPRAGTAVKNDGRLAPGIAAHLPVDEITASDLQHALRMRFDLGIQAWHTSLSAETRPQCLTRCNAQKGEALRPASTPQGITWTPDVGVVG